MKTVIASAILALFAGTVAASPSAGDFAVSTGSAALLSGSASTARSANNGIAISGASNQSVAGAAVGASSGSHNTWYSYTPHNGGSASISGDVYTGSKSTAYNSSAGQATGGAIAGGAATAEASGAGAFRTPNTFGIVAGQTDSTTANVAVSGRNGFAGIAAGNVSGFDASASAHYQSSNWGQKVDLTGSSSSNTYSVSGRDQLDLGNAAVFGVNGGDATSGALAGARGNVSSWNYYND